MEQFWFINAAICFIYLIWIFNSNFFFFKFKTILNKVIYSHYIHMMIYRRLINSFLIYFPWQECLWNQIIAGLVSNQSNVWIATILKLITYLKIAISMLSSRTLAINKYIAIMAMTSGWATSLYFHVLKNVWLPKGKKGFSLFLLLLHKHSTHAFFSLLVSYFCIISLIFVLFNKDSK